jgi:hypothetical protein
MSQAKVAPIRAAILWMGGRDHFPGHAPASYLCHAAACARTRNPPCVIASGFIHGASLRQDSSEAISVAGVPRQERFGRRSNTASSLQCRDCFAETARNDRVIPNAKRARTG